MLHGTYRIGCFRLSCDGSRPFSRSHAVDLHQPQIKSDSISKHQHETMLGLQEKELSARDCEPDIDTYACTLRAWFTLPHAGETS